MHSRKHIILFTSFLKYIVSSVALSCFLFGAVMAQEVCHFVNNIQISGLKHLSREAVLSQLMVSVDGRLEAGSLDSLIKQLYSTQWFKSVQVNCERNRLVISV